jgi:hypothetical protein
MHQGSMRPINHLYLLKSVQSQPVNLAPFNTNWN